MTQRLEKKIEKKKLFINKKFPIIMNKDLNKDLQCSINAVEQKLTSFKSLITNQSSATRLEILSFLN